MTASIYPAFNPLASISATAATSAVLTAIPTANGSLVGIDTGRFANTGTVLAYIKFGDATVVADVNSIALLPGVIEVFELPKSTTYFSVWTPSGTASINVAVGVGA